jgi:hypothetical protein
LSKKTAHDVVSSALKAACTRCHSRVKSPSGMQRLSIRIRSRAECRCGLRKEGS